MIVIFLKSDPNYKGYMGPERLPRSWTAQASVATVQYITRMKAITKHLNIGNLKIDWAVYRGTSTASKQGGHFNIYKDAVLPG